MNYKDWEKIYTDIARDLNIKYDQDREASIILNQMLNDSKNINDLNNLKNLIYNNNVIIFGAGSSLKKSILKNLNFIKDKIKITADGATSALTEFNIIPDIIVTDLDGKIRDQINANLKGSIIIIHSHGDNIEKIKNNFNKFKGEIIGSTQINPSNFSLLNNFGGFTDGDRGIFLSLYFKAKNIYLIGFDFNGIIGDYSFAKNKDKILKIKKLKWCKKIIDILMKNNKNIKYL
jgi:uncharacterized Rossmann fold enzyme